MTNVRKKKSTTTTTTSSSSPAAAAAARLSFSFSFFFFLLLLLLLCVSPCSSSSSPLFSTFSRDLAALESPAPPPSKAAEGKKYLVSTLSVGPSHAFVLARIARELVGRGGSVALLCPASMRPFFDVLPPGVKTLSIETGEREPTEEDFADESVRWRVIHYDTSGELMRRLPLLMKRSINDRLPWIKFHEFADALAVECDEVLSNAKLVAAARLFAPDVLVGDQMEPCFSVFGEKAFRKANATTTTTTTTTTTKTPLPPFHRPAPPPRVSVHNGPVITPAFFDSAGFELVGRTWGIPSEVGSLPVFGAGLPPPFSLRDRVSNLAQLLGMTAHNYVKSRPILQGLQRRHGVFPTREALRRDALLVLQGDWALDWPRPMPPSVLVAGPVMPGPAAKPLPEDLRDWLVDAKKAGEKVVYTALGATFVLTPEKSKAIVRALDAACSSSSSSSAGGDSSNSSSSGGKNSSGKNSSSGGGARILIKLSERDLPAADEAALREEMLRERGRGPASLLISRWLPQNDLLASGAVDAYVTHGGISSLSEAAYHGVPVVALPQGAEQPDNAAKVEYLGMGVGLRRGSSVEELASAVRRVLEDEDGKFAAAARAAAVRMRAGRPPAAAAVAAAVERVAVVASAAAALSLEDHEGGAAAVGWEMPGLRASWVAKHCVDSGLVLFGAPLLVVAAAISKLSARKNNNNTNKKNNDKNDDESEGRNRGGARRARSSNNNSRGRPKNNGAAEHAKLS